MIEMIIGIAVVISVMLFIFVIYNNKFELAIIKIEKAQEDIQMYLQKKLDLLNRTRPIVKKALKQKEFLEELEDVSSDVSNFDLHTFLKKNYNLLFKTLDENEKLLKSDSLVSILEELNNNEENIVGAIKFYNDTVVEFNQLVVAFPSLIIAFFKRYKKKEFYNNEKREIFEILNHE